MDYMLTDFALQLKYNMYLLWDNEIIGFAGSYFLLVLDK